MTSLGAFDFFGIREGCFHQCEAGNKTLHKYLQKLFSFSLNRHVKPVRLKKTGGLLEMTQREVSQR